MTQISIPEEAVPEDVLALCRELDQHGHQSWIVGGCVRDILRGGEAHDWDIATSARPDDVIHCFRRVVPTGMDHGTVTVLWKGEAYEVTTLRGEGPYSDGRRPDSVVFVDDIERDLARRDFTVNAIAYDPVSKGLSDPFGGRADIQTKTIRAVGEPLARFREDGLRVLRAARFCATLEFDLEGETEAAIPGGLDVFERVSAERVRDEWVKTLNADRPSLGFEVMQRTGILQITFPRFAALAGPKSPPTTENNYFTTSLRAVDAHIGPWPHRLAALLHAVGHGPLAGGEDALAPGQGADVVNGWMKRYRFSNKEREVVTHLIRHQAPPLDAGSSDEATRRYAHRVGPELAPTVTALAKTLSRAYMDEARAEAVQRLDERLIEVLATQPPLSTKALAISGGDIISLLSRPGGPWVKDVQRVLLDSVLANPLLNDTATLEGLVTKWAHDTDTETEGEGRS